MSDAAEVRFSTGLREMGDRYGFVVSDAAIETCLRHFRVLLKWNRVMNLIGDLTVESAVYRHYGESLFLATVLEAGCTRVADYGSGAGFPGIGVGAMRPEVRVDLLEIRQKRVAFLREATRSARNMRVLSGSAEDYPEALDAVVARAVDIGQIVDFASRRGVPATLLIGEVDAEKWRERLRKQGYHCASVAVPWRPQSVVFSARLAVVDPNESFT